MDEREGDMAEKGLAGEPEHDGGIFADAPEHGEVSNLLKASRRM
jgi:hypothetical protein